MTIYTFYLQTIRGIIKQVSYEADDLPQAYDKLWKECEMLIRNYMDQGLFVKIVLKNKIYL